MSDENAAPEPVKKFTYPFPKSETSGTGETTTSEVSNPQDYYDALALAEDGFYPIGYNGQWHGGIHFGRQTGTTLAQDGGVRCIANGQVIAYRIDEQYPTVPYSSCGAARYSTGFALVKHVLQLPEPDNTGTAATRPPTTVEASLEGAPQVEDGPANRVPPTSGPTLTFFSLYIHLLCWSEYASDPQLARPGHWTTDPNQFVVGAKAIDDNPYPDIEAAEGKGINVRQGGRGTNRIGWLPPGTMLTVESGQDSWRKITSIDSGSMSPDSTHQASADAPLGWVYTGELDPAPGEPETLDAVHVLSSPLPIKAGDLVGHLGQYQRYIDMDPIGSSCGSRPLVQVEVFTTDDIATFIAQSRERAAQLEDRHKTLLLVEEGARLVQAEGMPDAEILAAQAASPNGPASVHARVFPIKALEEPVTETDGTHWWQVEVGTEGGGSASGWVRERDHAGVRLCTPWDWPGFEIVAVDSAIPRSLYAHHVVQQGHATPDEQAELEVEGANVDSGVLFRRLYDTIDVDNDKTLTPLELRQALRRPWLAQALSHLIIQHESEWSGPMDKWHAMDDLIPDARKEDWEKEKERIESLLWWSDVKGNHGLPGDEPLVAYNFHPIGLVENFNAASSCVPLREAQELALRVSGGYEGRGDLDYHALADDFDGQGTSFGLIQWNFGQNTLGPLLLQMYNQDPVAFENSFPPRTNYQDLQTALINGDQGAQLTWVRNLLRSNRNGWAQAFHNLGDVEAFQEIQLQEALEYHGNVMGSIRIMRRLSPNLMEEVLVTTYVALYDLCVQQGSIDRGGAVNNITRRHASESPENQIDFLTIVVQERARTASTRWRADAMSRRMGIIQRTPYAATESGYSATRANPNFHLLEDYIDKHVCGL